MLPLIRRFGEAFRATSPLNGVKGIMKQKTRLFRKTPIAAAIGALTIPAMSFIVAPSVMAQESLIEEMFVPATRRSERRPL